MDKNLIELSTRVWINFTSSFIKVNRNNKSSAITNFLNLIFFTSDDFTNNLTTKPAIPSDTIAFFDLTIFVSKKYLNIVLETTSVATAKANVERQNGTFDI